MAEQYNNVIATKNRDGISMKQMPIISQIDALLQDISDKIPIRLVKAQKLVAEGEEITPAAQKKLEAFVRKARKFTVVHLQVIQPGRLAGTVSVGEGGSSKHVVLEQRSVDGQVIGSVQCACEVPKEQGMLCQHCVALIELAKNHQNHHFREIARQSWSIHHMHWYHSAHLVATYLAQYSNRVITEPTRALLPSDQVDLLPPPQWRNAKGARRSQRRRRRKGSGIKMWTTTMMMSLWIR